MYRLKSSRDSRFSSKMGTIPPIKFETVGHSARVLSRSGGMLLRKKLKICGLQTAGNALKLSCLPLPRYVRVNSKHPPPPHTHTHGQGNGQMPGPADNFLRKMPKDKADGFTVFIALTSERRASEMTTGCYETSFFV